MRRRNFPRVSKRIPRCLRNVRQGQRRRNHREKLGNMMRSIGQNPTDEEVNAMIKEVDLNSDGKIELDEFITLMSRNSQILKQRMKSSTHSECLTRKATD